MQVTILSELYINICNAQLFLERYTDARKSAQKAIEISDRCIEILQLQLKEPHRDPAEVDRIENLLNSQKSINVHANITIAQAFEQSQVLSEAVKQYNVSKLAVKEHLSAEHPLYLQMEEKIEALTKQLKDRSLKGSESMNVLIVSAKDDNEEYDSGQEAKLDDLENQEKAHRSVIGNSKTEEEADTIKGRGGRVLKKKTKRAKGTSKDVSSSSSALKYQIKENRARNGSQKKS